MIFVVPAAYGDGWSMSWLYDSVADLWAEWLPESALVDVRRGGFYQYSPVPGLREGQLAEGNRKWKQRPIGLPFPLKVI
ncbi:Sphingomyelin phosphodiesterase [Portunus trituberculatus]|uniref:Sphingomyelin phosphodiesterase n=1 Tax=Portunus trituberculatus TaxID=210409 RepID=A0A5B7F0C8_PORTR|nr:Sphingomyelin phosphodiesterase [Portunus trituberculatus]